MASDSAAAKLKVLMTVARLRDEREQARQDVATLLEAIEEARRLSGFGSGYSDVMNMLSAVAAEIQERLAKKIRERLS